MPTTDPIYYVEKVEIEADEETEDFEEINFDDDASDSDADEDLETALRSMQQTMQIEGVHEPVETPKAVVSRRPEVVDDFIRNFLIRYKMTRTLDAFQREWYEFQTRGGTDNPELVPDCYVQNEELENQVKFLQKEIEKMKRAVNKAGTQYIKMKKERDYHRMHHRRIVQEKEKLFVDIRRLKKHYQNYEPALEELKNKYETAMREKMLTKIECEKNVSKICNLTTTLTNYETVRASAGDSTNSPIKELDLEDFVQQQLESPERTFSHPKDSLIPVDAGVNPNTNTSLPVTCHLTKAGGYRAVDSFKAHDLAISNLALHPFRDVIATVSDDTTWKMWSVPDGELLLTGRGHTMWIGGCDFHPDGTKLATGSGDTSVKVWDFSEGECIHTFNDHSHPVWGVAWHHSGNFLASSSMDNTSKLFDLASERCRCTFRGHSDSVNSLTFLPYSNILCTCSADKTLSLWDIRTGLCAQTFYGHVNAINNVNFNTQGSAIASCDAYGVVKLWDVRQIAEIGTFDFEPHPANSVRFDTSGTCLAVASNDGSVKMLEVEKGLITELSGHEDGVQSAVFNKNGEMLISVSSDCTVKVWS